MKCSNIKALAPLRLSERFLNETELIKKDSLEVVNFEVGPKKKGKKSVWRRRSLGRI